MAYPLAFEFTDTIRDVKEFIVPLEEKHLFDAIECQVGAK